MEKNRIISSIVCNSLIILIVAFSVSCYFLHIFTIAPNSVNFRCFRYFTTDSNIFVALTSIFLIVYDVKMLRNLNYQLPNWVIKLKFVATVAVSVTFLVVLFYLAPIGGFAKLYYGPSFFLHLVVPVLAIVSCVFYDFPIALSTKACFLGVIPMAVYSIVYFTMVIIVGEANGGWEDFYHFNEGGLYLVSLFAMYLATFTLCYVFNVIRNRAITGPSESVKLKVNS